MRTLFCFLLALIIGCASEAGDSAGVAPLKDLGIADLLNVKAVSAVRHDQSQFDSPRSMAVITGEELRRKNFRTVPDAPSLAAVGRSSPGRVVSAGKTSAIYTLDAAVASLLTQGMGNSMAT